MLSILLKKIFSLYGISEYSEHSSEDLNTVRSRIINAAVASFSLFIIPSVFISYLRIRDGGYDRRFIIQHIMMLSLMAYSFVQKRYSLKIRTYTILAFLFIMAVISLALYGFWAGGIAAIIMFSVFSLLLLGKKAAYKSLALGLGAILIIGILVVTGIIRYTIDFNHYAAAPTSWIFLFFNVSLIGNIFIYSLAQLFQSLEDSIGLLKKQSLVLQETNLELRSEISERRAVETELTKEKSLTESILNSLPGVFYLYDERKQMIRWNKNQENVTGFSPAELEGKYVLDWFPENEHEYVLSRFNNALGTGRSEAEANVIIKNGNLVPFYFHSVLFEINGHKYLTGVGFDISDRKKAEKALRESEELYKKLVAAIPDIIIRTDLEGNIAFINETGSRLWGFSDISKVIGRNLFTFISAGDREAAYKNTREMFEIQIGPKEYRIELEEGKDAEYEVNGEILKESDGSPYGMVFVIRNIDERKRAEKELEEYKVNLERLVHQRTMQLGQSKELLEDEIKKLKNAEEQIRDQLSLFETTLKTVPIPVFIKDLAGAYVNCNRLFEEINGQSREEIIGNTLSDLRSIHDPAFHRQMDNEIYQSRKIISYQGTFISTLGEMRDAVFTKAPLTKSDGQLIGIIGIIQDVTEQKALEKNIQKSLEAEKQLNELKSRFISTTSHEFRTPLTAILSSTDLLQAYGRNWPDEKYIKHTSQIRRSVKYMVELLDDILEISRIESGKTSFNPEPVDLRDLCLEVMEIIKVKAGPDHYLKFDAVTSSGSYLLDSKLLRHILTNLLSNAVKYSPGGGAVELKIREDNSSLVFNVSDEGIGIPEAEEKNLTTPFYRAQNALHIPGTGLGLSIVKKAVEMHGGKLYFESRAGKGTTFSFSIPAVD
ncbi:MAG: PAS domain S-box protein [Syntrophothermus sp.]